MWHLQSNFFISNMLFVCLQVPLEEGLNKTIQYFSRELEHQANNQYIPKPKAARMKKGRPRHNWRTVFNSGILENFSEWVSRPLKEKRDFFWQSFEKQLRYRTALKSFFSVKCASDIEFTDLALHFGLSVVCLLFKISLDHVHFCSCMFTFCVLIDVTFFLSVSN